MRIKFVRPALMTAAVVAAAGILAGGLALRPAVAIGGGGTVGPDTTCNLGTPCKKYSNAGAGAGLQGINTNSGTSGFGLIGSATKGGNGVEGASASGVGVYGTSSTNIGVFGSSSSSYGVVGSTSSTTSPTAAGVQGNNNSSTIAVRANGFGGLLFDGNGSSGLDVFTVDNDGNTNILGGIGVDALAAGNSSSASGVFGQGNVGLTGAGYGSDDFGILGFNNGNNTALGVQDLSGGGVLMTGYDSSSTLKYELADDGTVYAHNFVQFFDAPRGQKVSNYATMSSTPNVEDFGEAQLSGGQTYVSLKSTFAGEIDSRFAYMVFITPEGDTRGLYVTQKTPAGFVVRENQGGRSDAAFSYRIVAKQFGATAASPRTVIAPQHRLPKMPTLHRVPKTRSN